MSGVILLLEMLFSVLLTWDDVHHDEESAREERRGEKKHQTNCCIMIISLVVMMLFRMRWCSSWWRVSQDILLFTQERVEKGCCNSWVNLSFHVLNSRIHEQSRKREDYDGRCGMRGMDFSTSILSYGNFNYLCSFLSLSLPLCLFWFSNAESSLDMLNLLYSLENIKEG